MKNQNMQKYADSSKEVSRQIYLKVKMGLQTVQGKHQIRFFVIVFGMLSISAIAYDKLSKTTFILN